MSAAAFTSVLLLLLLTISHKDAAELRTKWNMFKMENEIVPVKIESSANAGASRIINGMYASPGQFPWHVAIIGDSMALCGSSLISSSWLLTAAHCTYSFREFEIYMGSTTLNLHDDPVQVTTQKITHVGYDKSTHMNDIALLQLTKSVLFTENIMPISLPSSSDASKTYTGQTGIVSGYGTTSQDGVLSDYLMYAELPIITRQACTDYYGSIMQTETLFCTLGQHGTSTCNGDSGGALVIRDDDGLYTQIGLVSFGAGNACSNHPTGYTNVSSHLQWIRSQTGNIL